MHKNANELEAPHFLIPVPGNLAHRSANLAVGAVYFPLVDHNHHAIPIRKHAEHGSASQADF
jgi:hypothetical protein